MSEKTIRLAYRDAGKNKNSLVDLPLDQFTGLLKRTHIIVPKADLLRAAEALIDEYPDDFDEAILGQKLKAMIKE